MKTARGNRVRDEKNGAKTASKKVVRSKKEVKEKFTFERPFRGGETSGE